jgi:hypothetical protein
VPEAKVPAAQGVQAAEPGLLYVPLGHEEQAVDPGSVAYLPGSQSIHVMVPVEG